MPVTIETTEVWSDFLSGAQYVDLPPGLFTDYPGSDIKGAVEVCVADIVLPLGYEWDDTREGMVIDGVESIPVRPA